MPLSEDGPERLPISSSQFGRLQELLTNQGEFEGTEDWFRQQIIGKETKFGKVDVQPMGCDTVEVQIFSPDWIYTRFTVYEDNVEAYAEQGPHGEAEKIDLSFTLDDILSEL
ncbi:hypothetical protein DRQ26_06460 [bacterium]|nr:MAG: hypothetical protein DRQ26_06460 [bacterium]